MKLFFGSRVLQFIEREKEIYRLVLNGSQVF